MTMLLLLEHFDDLLVTPENAEQINNAVLQLAIRGKLLPQIKSDEPASELIKRIRNAKGSNTGFSLIKENEKPFELPNGWEWIRFGDVTINRDGERIPVSKEDREMRRGDFDYYGASGVIDKIDKYLFDKPLLLIGEDGANLINRSTPIAFIAHGKYWVNNHAHVLDAIDFGILKYLEVYINAIDLKPYITGTAQPKMNQAKMNSIVVALPPLAEQQRIVARVEELFARTRALAEELDHSQIELDGLNKSALSHLLASETPPGEFNQHWAFIAEHFDLLFQSPEHVAPLRQSILELAVRGKLTRREAGDESARELLKRILANRETQWENGLLGRAANKARFVETESLLDTALPELPQNWLWVRAEQVCGFITAGSTPSAEKLFSGSGDIPFLKVYNLTLNGNLDFSINPTFISNETHENQLARSRVLPGDVLMNTVGPPLGKVSIVPDTYPEWNINQAIAIFRPIDGLDRKYLSLTLLTKGILDWAIRREKGTAGQSNLSLTICRNLPIPLPPVAEQERIVKRVEQLLSLCDALEARLQSAEEERGRLVASVMAGVGGSDGE